MRSRSRSRSESELFAGVGVGVGVVNLATPGVGVGVVKLATPGVGVGVGVLSGTRSRSRNFFNRLRIPVSNVFIYIENHSFQFIGSEIRFAFSTSTSIHSEFG